VWYTELLADLPNEVEMNLSAPAILEFAKGHLVVPRKLWDAFSAIREGFITKLSAGLARTPLAPLKGRVSHQAIRFVKHENHADKSNVLWELRSIGQWPAKWCEGRRIKSTLFGTRPWRP